MTKLLSSSRRAPWLRALMLALAVGTPAAIVTTTTGSAPAVAQAGPEGEVDLETFHRELAPYGKWFEHPRYGEVWRPDVENDWRPYTRGHWSWTDDHGWYWVAEEEWGWAPFHYGRWVFDDNEEEWLWIPGTEWAPAWVQWRESEDTVGWAPLPPDSVLDGDSLRVNATAYDSPRYSRYWVFAAPAVMFLPGLYRHILPVSRYSTVWRNTRHVGFHHRVDRGRIFHPGIDHRRVGRWAGRTVPVVTLKPVGSSRDYGWRHMRSQTEVPVFRPRVVARTDAPRIQRPVWGAERRDGRTPQVNVAPRPDWTRGGRDGGRPDYNRDGNRGPDRRDDTRRDGGRDRRGDDDAARRQQDQARQLQQQQEQARQQQEQTRRQLEVSRQQQDTLRRQQEAARNQQDTLRQQQEAARRQQDTARQDALRQQQEAARRQQDATRQQQETIRRQQDAARQQQDAARRQQDVIRQQQEAARGAKPPVNQPQGGPPAAADANRRGDGQGRGGDGRGGDGRRRNQQPGRSEEELNPRLRPIDGAPDGAPFVVAILVHLPASDPGTRFAAPLASLVARSRMSAAAFTLIESPPPPPARPATVTELRPALRPSPATT